MKHLTDQYYGGNRLKELAAPVEGGDAANKEYVDAALKQSGVHVYRSLTGTAAKTTSPYWCARWDVADPNVTEYFDGMLVCVKVPVAGNGSYGTALQINDLGYKPIVWNLNSMITTRYPVGSVVWAVYNSTQTATLYLGNGSQAITGCWQVMDYNTDTTTVTNVRRYYGARLKPTTDLLDYVLVFRKNETHVVPMHSTPNGTSGAAAYTGSTRTDKEMTTESFDPFGEILFYRNGSKVAANAVIPAATLYQQNYLISVESTFNCGRTLTGNKELYLVVDLQSDGMVKLATDVNPWSQTLPTTNDGHLYICLGVMYNTYQIDFSMNHPIYYHDGTQLRMYTGAKIPTKTSELDNDSGFIAGPSASVEDNIPAFGNTSGNLAKDSDVSVRRLWEDVDVLPEMEDNSYYIAVGTGLWTGTTTTSHKIISVKDIRKVTITARTNRNARYAFLRTYTAPSATDIDTAPDYASGYTTAKEIPAGEAKSIVVPADANYLYVQQSTANYTYLPVYVKFTGIGITEHTGDGSGFVKDDGSVDNSEYLTSDDVSAVAMSGDYDDLENKPTIPAAQVNSDWNATSGKAQILNKPTLFSGSYNDLADKPTIPAAQIQSDWNQTDNTQKDYIKNKPSIPSKTSDLTNDSGFITNSDVVLVCRYNPTTHTMDKSPSDIVNAYNSGKIIIATNGDLRYYCYTAKSNLIIFRTLLGGIGSSPSTGEATIGVLGTRLICYVVDSWYHSDQYILQEQLIDSTTAPSGTTPNLKTINNQSILGSGNISIGDDMLVCTFTFNSGSNVIGTMDKTQQQISDAVNSGKTVICKVGNDVLHLISLSPYTFNKVNSAASTTIYFDSENTWYYESITLQPTLIGSGSYQNIKTINNQNITGPGNIDTQEILRYSAFGGEIQSGTGITFIDGEHPDILMEIDTARNAGKIVMLDIRFGYEPTAVLFMPACDVSPVYYSFTGSILYNGKIYFISMTPLKDQNGDYVYEYVGSTHPLDWVLKVKSINAVTIYKGSSAPSPSTGSDGDIYIMTTT